MKKSIAVLLTGMSLLMAPAAYAAEPVKLTGDVSVKYQKNTEDGAEDASGSVYTMKILGEVNLGSGWSLYARLGAQSISQPGFGDFRADDIVYGSDKKSVLSLDQFGLIYTGEKLTYKLGRQDAAVGTTALLYSRPDSNIGKKAFVDGVSVSGTVGATDISALLAREDNASEEPTNKIYAVRAGYSPLENLNWGLTLGRYQADESTNHLAVDGTYKLGKSSLTAEYTKSSKSENNKAYATTLNYDFDGKTSAYVTSFRVEANGAMGGQSDFDNDNRGFHYGITHKLTDAASLDIVYKDQKYISDGKKNTAFEATVSYSF